MPIPKKAFTQIIKGAMTRPVTVAVNEITKPAQTRKFQLLVLESKLPGCIFFDVLVRQCAGLRIGIGFCYACILITIQLWEEWIALAGESGGYWRHLPVVFQEITL